MFLVAVCAGEASDPAIAAAAKARLEMATMMIVVMSEGNR
jgi:hypothetical protein